MTSRHPSAHTSAPEEPANLASARLFGLLLLLIAALGLAFPFTVSTLQAAQASDKTVPQGLPPAPEGDGSALPYETLPQPQAKNPETRGGPDEFGYVFADNNNPTPVPGDPTFNWISSPDGNRVPDDEWRAARSISGTRTLDDGVVTRTLPFNFSFYGTMYDRVRISTNGNIHFGSPNDWYPTATYLCVPSNNAAVPQAMIAPLWYDLVVPEDDSNRGGVYTNVVGTSPNRIYVVEWRRLFKYNDQSTSATFEVLLYENGEIDFQYQEIVGNRMGGVEGVIGIQNANGTVGLPYACYRESVIEGRAIRYRQREAAILSPGSDQRGGARGSTLVYNQTLVNRTGITTSFTLTPSGNSWTTSIVPTHTTTLRNGDSAPITISVEIPINAVIGSRDVVTITANSVLTRPGEFSARSVLTSSVSSYGADFSPPSQTRAGAFGSTVTYSARLTNTSGIENSFVIGLSDNIWNSTVTPTLISDMPHNTGRPVTITVQVPADSTLGASDTMAVTANGQRPQPGQYFGITVLTTTAGVWQPRSLMPISRTRGAGVHLPSNGRIYALGGETANGNTELPIEEYDPVADAWSLRSYLPVPVSNVGAAVIGNAIYVAGGYNAQQGGAQPWLQIYYPLEDRAEVVLSDPLPAARMGAGVAAHGNRLYVIGGSDNSFVGTNTVFEYDPSRPAGSRWAGKTPMRSPRLFLAAASLNGSIYAVGGMPGAPSDLAVVEAYNPATDTWTTRAPMSRGRAGLALVGVNTSEPGCGGYLYAIGGGWLNYTGTAERYNPSANRWEVVSGLSSARRSLSAAYSPRTYSLVAFGGWSGQYEIATEAAQCSGAVQPPPTVTPCPITFSDVRQSDFFYEPVRYLVCAGVISGYSDNTFRPYANATRGQLAKIVVLAEGWQIYTPPTPTFSDVAVDNPFYAYIETAYNRGIISGYSDGTFRWGNDVTRGQLAKIIVLAEGWEISTPPTPTFLDVPPGSPFYEQIETAYAHAIISGYSDRTFRWGNPATRGQISKIVYNAVTQP